MPGIHRWRKAREVLFVTSPSSQLILWSVLWSIDSRAG
jgi:hypothetical protein